MHSQRDHHFEQESESESERTKAPKSPFSTEHQNRTQRLSRKVFLDSCVVTYISVSNLFNLYLEKKKRRTFCNRIVLYPHRAKSSLGGRQSRPRRRDDSTWRRPVVVPSRRRCFSVVVVVVLWLCRLGFEEGTPTGRPTSQNRCREMSSKSRFVDVLFEKKKKKKKKRNDDARVAASTSSSWRRLVGRWEESGANNNNNKATTRMRIKNFRSFANALEITWIRNASSGCRLLCLHGRKAFRGGIESALSRARAR